MEETPLDGPSRRSNRRVIASIEHKLSGIGGFDVGFRGGESLLSGLSFGGSFGKFQGNIDGDQCPLSGCTFDDGDRSQQSGALTDTLKSKPFTPNFT